MGAAVFPGDGERAGLRGVARRWGQCDGLRGLQGGGRLLRFLRWHVPCENQCAAHIGQETQRDYKGPGVFAEGACTIAGVQPLERAVARVREHIPAPLHHVADRQGAGLRDGVDGAHIRLTARLLRDGDFRALRRPQNLCGGGVGDRLGVRHRPGVQHQNAVGIVDGAQRAAGGFEQARIVEDRDAVCGNRQRPRQATAGQVEVEAGVPGVACGVGDRYRAGNRQACGGIGGCERDGGLGLRTGHELRVNRRALDREVAQGGGLCERHHAGV